MKSLAIVQATDIFALRSKLSEMNRAGLDFESKPKEINPASIEKILSLGQSEENNEVCALIGLLGDYKIIQEKIKNNPLISDVFFLDDSHASYKYLSKLIQVLPDIVISGGSNDRKRQPFNSKEKSSRVYLGVFVNRKVQVQTVSDSIHTGVLKHADSIGVFFEPTDDSDPLFITWHDIKKIIIPKEGKK